jgi:hypothetical protein
LEIIFQNPFLEMVLILRKIMKKSNVVYLEAIMTKSLLNMPTYNLFENDKKN